MTITGIVAAALVVHGFGMKLSGRMDGGAPFEKIRKWDAKPVSYTHLWRQNTIGALKAPSI